MGILGSVSVRILDGLISYEGCVARRCRSISLWAEVVFPRYADNPPVIDQVGDHYRAYAFGTFGRPF